MSILRVPVEELSEGECTLSRDASHYVCDVHRLGAGDALCLFEPARGEEADAVVVRVERRQVVCQVSSLRTSASVPTTSRVIVQAYGKGDKIDRVVRDATALGATRIVVVVTERSVVRIDPSDAPARNRRWQRIAIESARQSGRGDIPRIDGPAAFLQLDHVLGEPEGVRLVLDPAAPTGLLSRICGGTPHHVTVLVGPEGGWSSPELKQARAYGFVPVRFGRFILRTETAATAVLGALLAFDESLTPASP